MPEFPRCRNKSLKLAQSSGHNVIIPPRAVVLVDINSNVTSLSDPAVVLSLTEQIENNTESTTNLKKNNNLNRMNRLYKILSVVFKAINYGRGENPEGGDDASGRRSELGIRSRSRSVSENTRSRPPSAPSQRKPPVIRIRRDRSLNGGMWGSPQQLTTTSDSANTTIDMPINIIPDIELDVPTPSQSRRSRKRQKQLKNSTSDSYLNIDSEVPRNIVTSQYRQYFRPSASMVGHGGLQQSVSHTDLHSHAGSGHHLRVDENSRHPRPRSKSQSQEQLPGHYMNPNQNHNHNHDHDHFGETNYSPNYDQNHHHHPHYQNQLYSPEAERFVRAAIDKSQPHLQHPQHHPQQQQLSANQSQNHGHSHSGHSHENPGSMILLTPQPVERQIIRIINGNDPTVQSQVLLNTKTTQPWEDLVRDLGMAVKLPKKRGSHMETISGRTIQSYSQLRSELQVGNQAFYIFPHREDFAELGLPSLTLTQHNANARSRRNGRQENNPNLVSLQNSIQNQNMPLPILQQQQQHHQSHTDVSSTAPVHTTKTAHHNNNTTTNNKNNKNNNKNILNRNPTKNGKAKTSVSGSVSSGAGGFLSSNSLAGNGQGHHGHGPVIQRSHSHTTPLNVIPGNGIGFDPQQQQLLLQQQQQLLTSIPKPVAHPVRKSATTGALDSSNNYANIDNNNIYSNVPSSYQNMHPQSITNLAANSAGIANNLLHAEGAGAMANQNYSNLPMSSRSNPNLTSAPRSPLLQGQPRQASNTNNSNQQTVPSGNGTLQVPQNRKRSTRRRRSEASVYLVSARSRPGSVSP